MIENFDIFGGTTLDLNNDNNFVNKISNMTDSTLENLDLQVFIVSKAPTTDELFYSKKEILDEKLRMWLKKNIRGALARLKVGEEPKKFYVANYNHEIKKPDYIAELEIDKDDVLKEKSMKLFNSLNQNSTEFLDKNANFQIIKLTEGQETLYIIYYRGIKVSGIQKKNAKKMPAVRDREQLVIQENDIIEFGGSIELFVLNNSMYILNPRTLEFTFNYDDHIKNQRDENLQKITNMSFFDSESNAGEFIELSSQYILSRGLASITPQTLEALEESFEERCIELKDIKSRIPTDDEEKQEYLKKFDSLWPLYNHIDIENKKIRFDPNSEITPLIHFFSDKIVESFLTKKIKTEAM